MSRMVKRARIGVDLDGVVYNFVDSLKQWAMIQGHCNEASMPPAQCWDFFTENWGWTFDEYRERVIAGIRGDHIFRIGEPYEGAVEAIRSLIQEYEIIFITSRSGFGQEVDRCRRATLNWLEDYQIPFDGIIFVDDKVNRGVDVIIDDAPYQISTFEEAGQPYMIFDRPWNAHLEAEERVMDWVHCEEVIRAWYPAYASIV